MKIKVNPTITQNGKPPQKPAAPEEMLWAKPMTNTVIMIEPMAPDITSTRCEDIVYPFNIWRGNSG